jgi:cystathionine gamma-synthase
MFRYSLPRGDQRLRYRTGMDPFTQAIHADKSHADGADVAPAIRPSTTFTEGNGRRYRRSSHETTERFEAVLGALEGGHAVCYSSGMAAAAAVFDFFRPRRAAVGEVYHMVAELASDRVRRGDLEIVDVEGLAAGDLHWVESPSNPKCVVSDIEAISARNTSSGAITVVDSTFATPMFANPLLLGADVVMHSVTKGISGHSDAHAGALVVREAERAGELRRHREMTGAVPGSLDTWLALRGIRTLPLRAERAAASAESIASWASESGLLTYYPGLSSHPTHDVAVRQMRGFGTMLSIDVGSFERATSVVRRVKLFTNATSLGGVESLIEHRIVSDPKMDPGLIRLSIGLEDPHELIADLSSAL